MPTVERQSKRTKVALAFAAIAIFVSMFGAGVSLVQRFQQSNARRSEQAQINLAVCHASASDRQALRALVIQADKLLGTPRSAGYVYYKTHPEELAAAHAQTQYNLQHYLPVIRCSATGTPYKPGR